MIDPVGELLRSLDHSRPPHGIPRPHDGPLELQPERTLMALNNWCEGASEGQLGMLLIGQVVANRLRRPLRFGPTVARVILKPAQFSWVPVWTATFRPRLEKAFRAGKGGDFDAWTVACCAAFDVLERRVPDLCDGADHYFAPRGMVNGKPPKWASKMTATVSYRGHLFFRED